MCVCVGGCILSSLKTKQEVTRETHCLGTLVGGEFVVEICIKGDEYTQKHTHTDIHTITTKNTTLLYKESQLTIQMDKTTQSAWRQGRERAAERTSVAKQTESRERLSASQQCTAITTERKTQNGDTALPSVFVINYTDRI